MDDDFIHYGPHGAANSGFQAINLAHQFGATTIYLIGFDMCGDHFFGEHPAPLHNNKRYSDFEPSFKSIDQTKTRIINLSPFSTLDFFEKQTFDEAFK